jgi:hypothetical protein
MKYSVTFRQKSNPLMAYGTEVESTSETQAISVAQFQLKRLNKFDVSWIDTRPEDFGLHFLHGFKWDIEVKS